MKQTDLLRTGDNKEVIKTTMNAFIREGRSHTLRLWANDKHTVCAVITLSAISRQDSGVLLEIIPSLMICGRKELHAIFGKAPHGIYQGIWCEQMLPRKLIQRVFIRGYEVKELQ